MTQKERLDNGKKIFNDTLVEYSESDNIYEAISEWEFIYEVDCYFYDGDEKFIKESLKKMQVILIDLINWKYMNMETIMEAVFAVKIILDMYFIYKIR